MELKLFYITIILIIECSSLPIESNSGDKSEFICQNERIPNENNNEIIRFNLEKPVNPFIGRAPQLNQLKDVLKTKKPIIVSGVKGVGKSELIRRHIENTSDNKTSVIWIDSSTYETLTFAFNELGLFLKTDITDKSASEIIEEVFLLFINKPVLFVFDNGTMDNYVLNNLNKFVQGRPLDMQFIITTRDDNWNENKFQTLRIDVFTKDEAMDFVKSNINLQDVSDLEQFVDLLKYIPLALSKAVKYIKDKNVSDNNYKLNDFINDFLKIEHKQPVEMSPEVQYKKDQQLEDALLFETIQKRKEADILMELKPTEILYITSVRPPTREELHEAIGDKIEKEAQRVVTQIQNETKRGVNRVRNFFKRLRNDIKHI